MEMALDVATFDKYIAGNKPTNPDEFVYFNTNQKKKNYKFQKFY